MNTKVAKKNNKGFTLIELIVVIAIIAVLAAILAPQYLRYVEKSRVSVDCQSAAEIMSAAKTAAADESIYDTIPADGVEIVWKNTAIGGKACTLDYGTKKPADGDDQDKLLEEVSTTINGNYTKSSKEGPDRKSKTLVKYANIAWTVTIKPGDNGTMNVNGVWSQSDHDKEYTEKSGGKYTKSNATPQS